ncbi:hypothetical protein [Streptomyces sp. NPDC050485]|uniref:hypothetical protein n=1 Tax=Streptomyces sp. NPDC050485 TaxID=3365617 RepID=UPI00379ECBF8
MIPFMSNSHTDTGTVPSWTSSERKLTTASAYVVGILTITGWAAAMWLALIPVAGSNGSATQQCGVPALFNRASEQKKLSPHDDGTGLFDASAARYWADVCADAVGSRINSAVGTTVITLPLSALWIWCVSSLKRPRQDQEWPEHAPDPTPLSP